MRWWTTPLLVLGTITQAPAQEDDAAALALADKTTIADATMHPWHLMTEAAVARSQYRAGSSPQYGERLSLNLYYDEQLVRRLRVVVSDRLDLEWQRAFADSVEINTLKEAYASWQPSPSKVLDVGRINMRSGVAMAYNPTDYLRSGAVRSVVSASPESLRENRLGAVMLRGQALWNGGSLTALFAPRLADTRSDGPFSADLGASNGRDRWLVALTEDLARDLSPQLILTGADGESLQVGANITHLLNSGTVAFLEWSGGRSATLMSQASGAPGSNASRSRLAAGFTYTAANRMSVSLEYDHNDAAPNREQWNALRASSGPQYQRYLQFVSDLQDLPTRGNLFARIQWTDSLALHLDLAAFVRLDIEDHSRLNWAEARYHWSHADVALQAQFNSGGRTTVFGASSRRQLWQALFAWYLP